MTSKTNQANVQIITYIYDPNGRVTNRWTSAKGNTSYTCDANGNVTLITHPSSHNVTLAYDALNRVTNMVDAVGTTMFTYTSNGDLLTEVGPWTANTMTYGYDANVPHLRKSLSLSQPTSSWTNGLTYDAAKRFSTLTSQAGTFTYSYYTGSGGGASSLLPNKIALPNSSYITNAYDSVARLLDTSLKNSGNTVLDDQSYVYNTANQRTKQTRTDASYVNFTYDNIGQLQSGLGYTSGGTPITTEQKGYTYDAGWNLSQRTNNGAVTTLTVNVKNELTSGPNGITGVYDNDGNRTSDSSRTYTYDDDDQLVEFIFGSNSYKSDLTYDGLGRLRTRLEYSWNGSSWVLNSTTRYLYDGRRVIQERDGSNNPTVSYTRGPDLSGSWEGAGGVGGLLAKSSGYSGGNWSSHYPYHADGNGNITAMVDSTQTIVASYRYDSYGNSVSQSGTQATANVYRFQSKEIHANAGLYYYGFRWYDPNLQRFISRDPIGEDGGINLYEFVGSDPIDYFDLFGLDTFLITFDPNRFFLPHTAVWVSNSKVNCIYSFDPANNLKKYTPNQFWGGRDPNQPFHLNPLDPGKVDDSAITSYYDSLIKQKVKYIEGPQVCSTQARKAIETACPEYVPQDFSGMPAGLRGDLLRQRLAKPDINFPLPPSPPSHKRWFHFFK